MVLFHSIASNIIKLQKTRQKLGKNSAKILQVENITITFANK